MSFEVGPQMPPPTGPRPTGRHEPQKPHLPGVTPPPRKRRDEPDPWYGKYILFPLFMLVLIAAPLAWVFRYPITRALLTPDQSHWPTVMATVTGTTVDHSGRYELADDWRLSHGTRSDRQTHDWNYVPEVDYSFTVGTKSYTGSSLSHLPRIYNFKSDAEQVLANYPKDSLILVHFNPQDPSDSIVDQSRRDLVGTWSDSQRH